MESKTSDAVQFMRQAREKIDEEMRDMSFEEQRAYIEQHRTEVQRVLQLRREGMCL
jgi:hypothetical protein